MNPGKIGDKHMSLKNREKEVILDLTIDNKLY